MFSNDPATTMRAGAASLCAATSVAIRGRRHLVARRVSPEPGTAGACWCMPDSAPAPWYPTAAPLQGQVHRGPLQPAGRWTEQAAAWVQKCSGDPSATAGIRSRHSRGTKERPVGPGAISGTSLMHMDGRSVHQSRLRKLSWNKELPGATRTLSETPSSPVTPPADVPDPHLASISI